MSGSSVGIKIEELLDRMERVIEEKRTRKIRNLQPHDYYAAISLLLTSLRLEYGNCFRYGSGNEVSGNTGCTSFTKRDTHEGILKKAGVTEVTTPTGVDLTQLHTPHRHALLPPYDYLAQRVIQASLTDMSLTSSVTTRSQLASLFNNFYAA